MVSNLFHQASHLDPADPTPPSRDPSKPPKNHHLPHHRCNSSRLGRSEVLIANTFDKWVGPFIHSVENILPAHILVYHPTKGDFGDWMGVCSPFIPRFQQQNAAF